MLTCDFWIMIYTLHQQDKVLVRIQSCLWRIFYEKLLIFCYKFACGTICSQKNLAFCAFFYTPKSCLWCI